MAGTNTLDRDTSQGLHLLLGLLWRFLYVQAVASGSAVDIPRAATSCHCHPGNSDGISMPECQLCEEDLEWAKPVDGRLITEDIADKIVSAGRGHLVEDRRPTSSLSPLIQ